MKQRDAAPLGAQSVRLTVNEAPEKVDDLTRRFKLSDSSVALDGHTLAADGWDLSRAQDNMPVLWAHDAETVEHVLGQWQNLRTEGDSLLGDAVFMPREVNPAAGMVLDMIDGGWLRMCSVGFVPTEGKPSKRGPGTYDFTRQTLLEASIVPVGSLATALIQARAAGIDISPMREWAPKDTETSMGEKPAVTEERMFPQESNVAPDAPTPDSAEESTTENQPSARALPMISKRGLYSVAELAYALMQLGWITEEAEWEAEYEGDGSQVPAMLQDCLKALGEALVAMTQEEVAELLGEDAMEGAEGAEMGSYALLMSADAETRAAIIDALRDAAAGKAVSITTTRAVGRIRAGKMMSKENLDLMKSAHERLCGARDLISGLIQRAEADVESTETNPVIDEAERAAARARRERLAKTLQAQLAD